MRKGFTIIELLVASLLLGMLVTILTMIFNQSSIAWRIAYASTSDLDDVRDNIALIREEADNAFVSDDCQTHLIYGLWREDGQLRDRACDVDDSKSPTKIRLKFSWPLSQNQILMLPVGSENGSRTYDNYTVNVMSGGPKNDVEDWEAIWSYPDDPSEW